MGLQEAPLNFGGRFQLGVCLHQAKRLDEAEMEFRQLAKMHPSTFQGQMFLILNYAAKGDLGQAVAIGEEAFALAPWHSHPRALLAGALVMSGQRARADELMAKIGSTENDGGPTPRACVPPLPWPRS